MGHRQRVSRRTQALCLLFSGLALCAAACDGGNEKSGGSTNKDEPPPILDLKQGSFAGVALGDTAVEMHRVFGAKSPAGGDERITALSVGDGEDYSPLVLGPRAGVVAYLYEHVVFMVGEPKIGAIIVNDPEARARDTDVGIGDKLARARAAYELECGIANENTEYEPFPACVGRIAPGVYVWFGQDPIRNITIARVLPGGL